VTIDNRLLSIVTVTYVSQFLRVSVLYMSLRTLTVKKARRDCDSNGWWSNQLQQHFWNIL